MLEILAKWDRELQSRAAFRTTCDCAGAADLLHSAFHIEEAVASCGAGGVRRGVGVDTSAVVRDFKDETL